MYNVVANITITQIPNREFPNRNNVLRMGYVNYYEWDSGWENLTDKGRIVIPRNVYYKDDKGTVLTLKGNNISVGGFNDTPLFLRGDKVVLSAGYTYFKDGKQITEQPEIINGYISKVHSKIPIEFEVEDNMWLLKQTPLPNKTFTSSNTLEDVLQFICDNVKTYMNTEITYKKLGTTSFGSFIVNNETAAQVLARLKSTYGFVSFFRGTVIHCGTIIQYADEVQTQQFHMNGITGNIPAEGQDLEYTRKDDVVLSAVAHNTIIEETGGTTKDGKAKTKKKRLEVLVTFRNNRVESKVIEQGERVPEAMEGERSEFYFPSATTTSELIKLATEELERYYYTGLKGEFQTFGIPFMKHGDVAVMTNFEANEQNGSYRSRHITYTGGVNGLRQTIKLDYRL
jgi:hypothetical protein